MDVVEAEITAWSQMNEQRADCIVIKYILIQILVEALPSILLQVRNQVQALDIFVAENDLMGPEASTVDSEGETWARETRARTESRLY